MATYKNADAEVGPILNERIESYHPELREAGVTVTCLFAYAPRDDEGTPKGPAIKTPGGHPMSGTIKIHSHQARVSGHADCAIILDGDRWPDWSEDKQRAIVDDLLENFELQLEGEGVVKLDDSFRPKLRKRLPDFELRGFARIAERHGDVAPEVEVLKAMVDDYGRILMPFMQPAVPTDRPHIAAM